MVDQIQTQVKLKPLTPKTDTAPWTPKPAERVSGATRPDAEPEIKPNSPVTDKPYVWEPQTVAALNEKTFPKEAHAVMSTHAELCKELLEAPMLIAAFQKDFDLINRKWQIRKVELTINAYSTPLFPGKKDGDGLRCASNEAERETAIDKVTLTDEEFAKLSDERDTALRNLMRQKNQYEALKTVAQVILVK